MPASTSDERTEDPQVTGAPIARALARHRKVTGVDLTFSGSPDTENLRLTHFDGPVAGPLRAACLDVGHGLGGRVMAQQRSLALHDYLSAQSIVHTYDSIIRAEHLRAMVAAPVIVGRQFYSVLYAAALSPQTELGASFDAVTAEARALEQTLAVASALEVGPPLEHPGQQIRPQSRPPTASYGRSPRRSPIPDSGREYEQRRIC